jgi:hypothetical protein
VLICRGHSKKIHNKFGLEDKFFYFKANKKDTWKKKLPTNSMKSCFDDLDMLVA